VSNNISSVEVSATLESVIKEFDLWRSTRQHKERIPERLWDAAISLVKSYPSSRVAQKLRLNYSDFKHRINEQKSPMQTSPELSFVEVSLPKKPQGILPVHSRGSIDISTTVGISAQCNFEGDIPDNFLKFLTSIVPHQ